MESTEERPNHDELFKYVLTQPNTAKAFLSLYLPEDVRSLCHFPTLRLEPGSFIDEKLSKLYTDVLYSVETVQGEGYIYCLIEHQSTPDPMMAWRLMQYSVSVMASHLKNGHKKLPLVVPMLFYHGKIQPYPYSMQWLDCFDQPEQAARLYSQPFPLVDLSVRSDEEILTHPKEVAMLEWVQKHIRERDMQAWINGLIVILDTGYNKKEQLEVLLRYLLHNGHAQNFTQIIHHMANQLPEDKNMVMTIAEELKQEGRREGREEGRKEAKLETARAFLQNGVSVEIIIRSTGLSREQIDALRH
ncbi:Rpn family recombination-promoting nuclease/putative transposase [Xenorhabdus sp. IM139775]|uniref:Rpn family recombination-promoting nuclease/putative transposase n=1 Tax=Xenorhabdus sp. IM139775 TaxID=3025876 RepID=UPI00235A4498|nr:Rpn family recombination-promoting nuclease/putative transposase [Xenorhabdus sp. IM139775]MDC9593027.1 Rpn family recombination-promoting nuclease/putative transposase [Xenorhabdus sp. IM139775]